MMKRLLMAGLLCGSVAAHAQKVTTYSNTSGAQGLGTNNSSTIANAKYYNPYGVAVDSKGNAWVSDVGNNMIILLLKSNGLYERRAGGGLGEAGYADGGGTTARFDGPMGIVFGENDTLFVADHNNNAIRRIAPFASVGGSQVMKTIAGGGDPAIFTTGGDNGYNNATGFNARFDGPTGIAISNDKSYLLVVDQNNQVIRKLSIKGSTYGQVTLFAGKPNATGSVDGAAIGTATFDTPQDIYIDKTTGDVYITEIAGGIRKITLSTMMVSTVVPSANVSSPTGITAYNGFLYFSDFRSCHLSRYDLAKSKLEVFTGSKIDSCGFKDGDSSSALFFEPGGMTVFADSSKNFLLVADVMNNSIRKVTLPAAVSTGISESSRARISIYPNPANDYLMIENNLSGQGTISLTDMTGRELQSRSLMFDGTPFRMELGMQPAGIYFVKVSAGQTILTRQVMIGR